MREKTSRPLLSAAYLTAAAICFVDPSIAVFELLPDALGWWFLYLALSTLAVTVPHFDEARDGCRRLILLSICRLPAALLLFAVLQASPADRPMITVFALAFAVLELCFVLPTIRRLFDGFYTLSTRFGMAEADGTPRISLQGLRYLSYFAFSLRAVLAALPEFLLLGNNDPLTGDHYTGNYFGVAATVAALLSLVVSLIWCLQFLPYARRVSAGCEGSEALLARRAEMRRTEDALSARGRISWLCLLLSAAAFCSCDLLFDDVNYLPDALSGILLLLFALLAFRAALLPKTCAVSLAAAAGTYAAVSLASYVMGLIFAANYRYTDLGRKRAADALFRLWNGFSVAEAAAGVATLVLLLFALMALSRAATGRIGEDGTPSFDAGERRTLRVKAILLTVSGGAAVAFPPIELYLRHFVETVEANPAFTEGTVKIQPYGGLWILALFLSLLFFALTLFFCSTLREQSRRRFPLL